MGIIRQKAIEQLKCANPPLDPIDQIIAARKYDCMELAETSMEALVNRRQLLSIEEIVKLSPEDLHTWIIKSRDLGQMCTGCNGALASYHFCAGCY